MKFTQCLAGIQKIRHVPHHGGDKLTSPLVCIVGTGHDARLGIASCTEDSGKAMVWCPIGHHKIIPTWRAMKLLEMVDHIGDTTLYACWSLFHHKTRSEHDVEYIRELAKQFRGQTGFANAYNSIVRLFPSLHDLDTLLSSSVATGIRIDTNEVFDAIKACHEARVYSLLQRYALKHLNA